MVALFVVLTIVVLILADGLLQRSDRPECEGRRRHLFLPASILSIPSGVFHDVAHTWINLTRGGRVRIGIDSFVQYAIGEITEVSLPKPEHRFQRGEILFRIRQGTKELAFVSPVDGVVCSVNKKLASAPDVIEKSPYTKGWICSMIPDDFSKHLRDFSLAEEAKRFLHQEARRLNYFLVNGGSSQVVLGRSLPDGGELTEGALSHFDSEVWEQFGIEFLTTREKDEDCFIG